MAYELETIETKISENIILAASESIIVDGPEFLKDLDSECAKIKRAFKHQVVSFENENLIKRYFHFHQESLIDLINTIQLTVQSAGAGGLAESVISRLSNLLAYLEEHFPEYFDLDMKMPFADLCTINSELRSFSVTLSDKFTNCNVDIGLIELLKNSIDDFLSKDKAISFRVFYYVKFLKMHLASFRVGAETETIDLIRILLHCNFNEESFYNYLLRYIQWSINKVVSVNEKLDELAFYLKFVNQETPLNNLAFNNHGAPSEDDLVSGTYVREYSREILNQLSGNKVGMRTVRDTLYVTSAGHKYKIENAKWSMNDYDND